MPKSDDDKVARIMEMGFSKEAAQQALQVGCRKRSPLPPAIPVSSFVQTCLWLQACQGDENAALERLLGA